MKLDKNKISNRYRINIEMSDKSATILEDMKERYESQVPMRITRTAIIEAALARAKDMDINQFLECLRTVRQIEKQRIWDSLAAIPDTNHVTRLGENGYAQYN